MNTIYNIKNKIIINLLLNIYKLFADMQEKPYLCGIIL